MKNIFLQQCIIITLVAGLLPAAAAAQQVDILWEANSYTPPFYRGKALYPPSGDVRVSAITTSSSGNVLNPANLTYRWHRDGSVLGSRSGRGVDSLFLSGSTLGRDILVQVDVENSSGALIGSDAVRLRPVDPLLLLYEQNPLLGTLFNKEIGNAFTPPNQEVVLSAHPYHFTGSQTSPTYTWQVNRRSVDTALPTITIRATDEINQASIFLSARHPQKILQAAEIQRSIDFDL